MKRIAAALLALSCLTANADDFRDDRIEFMASNAADLATTAAALSLGAVELNPLGVFLIPAKAVAYYRIKAMPLDEQQPQWDTYNAVMWGAAANNACAALTILTGGTTSLPCVALGAVVGWWDWKRAEGERHRQWFIGECAKMRENNPDMKCNWHGEEL